jgi:hypothetical protein
MDVIQKDYDVDLNKSKRIKQVCEFVVDELRTVSI